MKGAVRSVLPEVVVRHDNRNDTPAIVPELTGGNLSQEVR